MGIGDDIKAARLRAGISQEELGKRLGVTRGTVSHWEKGRNLPLGSRLAEVKEALGIERSDAATDGAVIREIDGRASAGAGAVIEYDDTLSQWVFPKPWVRSELRAREDALRMIVVEGDSMVSDPPAWNDLMPGDRIVINTEDRTPSPPGFFVVFDGFGLVVKRVSIVHGRDEPTITLASNNAAYAPYELTASEAHIVGRVIGRWQRL